MPVMTCLPDTKQSWVPLAFNEGKLIIGEQKQMKCVVVNKMNTWPLAQGSGLFRPLFFAVQHGAQSLEPGTENKINEDITLCRSNENSESRKTWMNARTVNI